MNPVSDMELALEACRWAMIETGLFIFLCAMGAVVLWIWIYDRR